MDKTVQAVYENGVLRPLEPLFLDERQQVTVTIYHGPSLAARSHPLLISSEEWSHATQNDIDLEEVRRALATIRGSLSEAALEERRER